MCEKLKQKQTTTALNNAVAWEYHPWYFPTPSLLVSLHFDHQKYYPDLTRHQNAISAFLRETTGNVAKWRLFPVAVNTGGPDHDNIESMLWIQKNMSLSFFFSLFLYFLFGNKRGTISSPLQFIAFSLKSNFNASHDRNKLIWHSVCYAFPFRPHNDTAITNLTHSTR